jgi:hypothetical protein
MELTSEADEKAHGGLYGFLAAENYEFSAPYSPHAAKASAKARSPGAPFSMAMMARFPLT